MVLLQACVSSSSTGDKPPTEEDAAIANMNLGAGYLRQGRPELAIERLQRSLQQNPKLADAHTYLAMAYAQLGGLEDAETHYKRATQLEPENSKAANSYAVFLCQQNRWPDAEPYFKRSVANLKYQTPEVAYTNAGRCALEAGDRVKAEENFRAALSRNPTYPEALASMLDMSYQDKKYLEARAFLQRYRDVKPPNAQVLWMCFNVEQQLQNRDSANRCAAQLRDTFPDSAELAQLNKVQQSNGR
jgi:type IV pilus assembly protein PilF